VLALINAAVNIEKDKGVEIDIYKQGATATNQEVPLNFIL
jgi:hypothetical protein